MNAIVLAVLVMVGLTLSRVSVVFALLAGALVGGLYAGMPVREVVRAFNDGLGSGANVALAYAALGAFAVALSHTGLSQRVTRLLVARVSAGGASAARLSSLKWGMTAGLIAIGCAAETIVPVHIAFIPILVPPLLRVMNAMQLDRRLVACAITFSITVTYMFVPVGFGKVFLNNVLAGNINQAGRPLDFGIDASMVPAAMLIPALGMLVGLLLSFVAYRRTRRYEDREVPGEAGAGALPAMRPWQLAMVALALLAALAVQLWTDSMVFGGLVGFALVSASGLVKWREQDSLTTQGLRLMAQVGFIMIAAAGFAAVMRASGAVPELVDASTELIGSSKAMAALVMLVVGLLITLGIGSSFSTVPIIASIYVPLGIGFGFSPLAIVALIGTAAALGDAGSPASDSTLGPTAGLGADGQHDHIRDTVIPTFIYFNLPLLLAGWIAAVSL
jgi:predicted histidine transporter YuiF (NhaC family)